MIIPEDTPCPQCSAEPGEAHRDWDDIARCYYTGTQLIQCGWHPDDEDEIEDYEKREYYKAHPLGECAPSIWDGDYPGSKQCQELGWFTDPNSTIYSYGEDLNALAYAAFFSEWDVDNQKWIITDETKEIVEEYREKNK